LCGLAQTIKAPRAPPPGRTLGAVALRRGGAWTERGLINAECIFTSAAGVYSGTAAEHALALMLAGARRLDGATSSAYRPS
jgi:lactate dehydrogenase-like 2-hydroxyacid dehydrogenase